MRSQPDDKHFNVLCRTGEGWLVQSYRGARIYSRKDRHLLSLKNHPLDGTEAHSVAYWIAVIDAWRDRSPG